MKPIVLTIAGSDSSGGAGIQADLKAFQSLGVHGCSVITAITAQNPQTMSRIHYVPADSLAAQLKLLPPLLSPKAIKIGMVGNDVSLHEIASFLKSESSAVVLDPVIESTSGMPLYSGELHHYLSHLKQIFPYITIITPNLPEAEMLVRKKIHTTQDMEMAAHELLQLGVKNVLIKGGHRDSDEWSQDYWTNGQESFWLSSKRYAHKNYRGTGCTFSACISACLALGYDIKDALVIAKMYINRGIRLSHPIGEHAAFIEHAGWPEDSEDLPYLSDKPLQNSPPSFLDCGKNPLGLYPVIDSFEWLQTLLPTGVKTIQLRIKNKTGMELEREIKQSVQLAKQYEARLFINDYWELAISCGAYGVHLGQEDLMTANVDKIRQAGLRLGISTHCYYEVARAHAFHPSYLACGPIFETTSKQMVFSPQGISQLNRYRKLLSPYPLVAIGGINHDNIQAVLQSHVDGIAVISAITKADNPMQAVKRLMQEIEQYVR